MFKVLEDDKVYEVVDDDDPDKIPSISVDDNDEEKDDGKKKYRKGKGL